jgi:hypothetical protein
VRITGPSMRLIKLQAVNIEEPSFRRPGKRSCPAASEYRSARAEEKQLAERFSRPNQAVEPSAFPGFL